MNLESSVDFISPLKRFTSFIRRAEIGSIFERTKAEGLFAELQREKGSVPLIGVGVLRKAGWHLERDEGNQVDGKNGSNRSDVHGSGNRLSVSAF